MVSNVHAMLSRRQALQVTLAGAGALALGACASRVPEESSSRGTHGAAAKKGFGGGTQWDKYSGSTLSVLLCEHWWTSAIQKQFKQFESLTGIKVKANTLSEDSYFQQALVALSSGASTYDAVMVGNLQAGQYLNAGWLESLEQYFTDGSLIDTRWFNVSDFFAASRKAGSKGGELFALPLSAEAGVVMYRRDLLKQAGVSGFPTQESLLDAAVAMDSVMKRPFVGRGRRGLDVVWTWTNYFLTFGGEFFDGDPPVVDSEAGAKATELYVEQLLGKHGPAGAANMGWLEATGRVNEGKAGIYTDASGLLSVVLDKSQSKHTDQIGVARWPKSATGKASPNYWYWMAGIPAAARNKEAAALFYAWALSPEVATQVSAQSGSPSARKSVWSDEKFLSFYPHDTADEIVANLAAVEPDRVPYARPTFPKEADALSVELLKVLTDNKPAKAAMSDAAARMAKAK